MTTPDDQPKDQPARRPSPASRARRIGGLSATTSPRQPARATDEPAGAGGADPVDLSKASAAAADDQPAPAAAEPAAEPAAVQTDPRRVVVEVPAWLRWLPALALGLAAIVMIVYFAIVSHGVWWGKPSANAVRDQVLSSAKQCFADANTYHYTSLKADEAKGAACTTGTWHTNYLKAMSKLVNGAAKARHAVQVAQVGQAGISSVSADGRTWTIFVVGQLDIHATGISSKGRTDPVAALVQMVRVEGRWRIAQLQEVAGPTSS